MGLIVKLCRNCGLSSSFAAQQQAPCPVDASSKNRACPTGTHADWHGRAKFFGSTAHPVDRRAARRQLRDLVYRTFAAQGRGPSVFELARPATKGWDDVVGTCTMIRAFCTTGHAEQWTADNAPSTGYIAPINSVWELAGPWYGDRLEADFQPHSRAYNQQLLDSCGLTGRFWQPP